MVALIFSIVSLIFLLISVFISNLVIDLLFYLFAIVALVFGIIGIKKNKDNIKEKTAVVISDIVLIVGLILFFVSSVIIGSAIDNARENNETNTYYSDENFNINN